MTSQTAPQKHELRPIAMLVTVTSLAVASLLITTASLGASPTNALQYEIVR